MKSSCTACWRLTWSGQRQWKRGFDIKGLNFSDRDLERHEAKRDIRREVLDGIDEKCLTAFFVQVESGCFSATQIINRAEDNRFQIVVIKCYFFKIMILDKMFCEGLAET
jgi:hypothetical protein